MRTIILAFLLTSLAFPAFTAEQETVYDRVLKTGELRCGYGVAPPILVKDLKTGEVSGIMADVMNEIGKILSLKIVWAEEIDWGALGTALESRRVDAICSTMWGSGARGRTIAYSQPLFFSKIDAFVRADDTRFTGKHDEVNRSDVRLAVSDNDVSEEVAKGDFSKATRIPKVNMMGDEFLLMDVMTGKADITFVYMSVAKSFMKANLGKLRHVAFDPPLRVYPNVLGVNIREQELRDMLNAALTEVHGSGRLERIFSRYSDELKDMILRVARPYEGR